MLRPTQEAGRLVGALMDDGFDLATFHRLDIDHGLTAARCLALGRAIGSYPQDVKVAVFGTGGMSHRLAGARAGLINPEFDRMFLRAIESEPEKLAALTREDYIREAGTEGIELIMWLVMRGALSDRITRIHDTYHVPASNTATALALFEDLGEA